MERIIEIPDHGEVRFSLKEYNEMRDRIRSLEEHNDQLTEILDKVCDENKVCVRRQIIRVRVLATNPHALGQEEIIEDRMVNMEDIVTELQQKIDNCEKEYTRKCTKLELANARVGRTLDQCQQQKIKLEQEVYRLKHRDWWDRLMNNV